uniref:Ulp1 protease family, C-terminal catalytic domain containing protein n=1 Tax=Solanum tuberosum TaxID=4113 RepID=M1DML2_SOLTU
MFMEKISTENDCSNVQPTQEELESLDLPTNSHVPPYRPTTSVANQEEDISGISMPHIVDDSVDKGNVDLESASDQLFQQPISPIKMDFATVDHDGDASDVEVEQRLVNEENVAKATHSPSRNQYSPVGNS